MQDHGTAAGDWRARTTLTVEQTAEVLGLGRSAAYAAANRGELPAVRVGKRLLVPTARLRALLGENVESATATNGDALSNTAAGACHDSVYKH